MGYKAPFVMTMLLLRWAQLSVLSAALLSLAAVCASTDAFSKDQHMVEFPLSPIDANINRLSSKSTIHSVQDAEAYIDALLEKYKLDDAKVPGLSALKPRVARAEYAAVLDPTKEVSEALVADVFNKMMNEWVTPLWTRISVEELHAFRVFNGTFLYPAAVSRSASGDVSRSCRPVEAIYTLYLLESNRGVPLELRELIRQGRWPKNLGDRQPVVESQRLQLLTRDPVKIKRDQEYLADRNAYFAAHPSLDPAEEVNRLLHTLRIE